MANFNVEVIVDPSKAVKGSRQAIKSLGQVEQAADRLRNTLRNTFAGVGIGLLVTQIVQLTDVYTNLQNRLRVVTQGQQQLVFVTQELFDISRRTRSSFEGTAELYSRLALAGRELGVTMKDLTQFTETMNKAIILSGASGREANAGLIQLSQGIASGALRGDELRSVLEQLPVVADVIAKQMKVTRGELRAMGAEGAITAEIILAAFKNAREEISERFGKTIPTISQSFQVFRNSLVKNIGAFNTANGAATTFSKTILLMSDNMDVLLRSVSALAIAIGIGLAAKAIPALIIAMKALTVAIATNPFGVLLVTISALIGILVAFGDQILVEQGKLTTFKDVAIVVWDRVSKSVKMFIDFFQNNFGFIAEFARDTFHSMKGFIGDFIRFAARNIDRFIGFWKGAFDAVIIIWDNFPIAMEAIFILAMNNSISRVESGLNKIIGLTNKAFKALDIGTEISNILVGRLKSEDQNVTDVAAALALAFEEGFNFDFFQQGVEDILKKAEAAAIARKNISVPGSIDEEVKTRVKVDKVLQSILKGLNDEIKLLKMSTDARGIFVRILKIEKKLKRELNVEEKELVTSRLKEIQLLERQVDIYEKIKKPVEGYKNTLKALNSLLIQGKINQNEFNLALKQTELGSGIQDLKQSLSQELSLREGQTLELQEQLLERNMLLQQAREANLISEQEQLDLSLQANKSYNQAILDIEHARLSEQFSAASNAFKAIANTTKGFVGGQSKAYQALFAISKGFAAADTAVQIANAIGKAANNPWPQNLAAISQVVALTSGLISSIAGTQYAGAFRTGGDFTVGGSGGPDSKMVSFRATPGEHVSVRTPQQTKNDTNDSFQSKPEINLSVANFLDPDLLESFLESTQGDQVFMNKIQQNAGAINQLLRK